MVNWSSIWKRVCSPGACLFGNWDIRSPFCAITDRSEEGRASPRWQKQVGRCVVIGGVSMTSAVMTPRGTEGVYGP
jgi:hypothetical protein